ncbi:LOW QUALITY PROTEIN: hypothetical protein NC651_019117 [Populus alba x Populus x berolinensis]|nr:LOW QUALITY PROTEIN: hypothetical protein NC651_019117 [Populus alba x Populus x berolinensis]
MKKDLIRSPSARSVDQKPTAVKKEEEHSKQESCQQNQVKEKTLLEQEESIKKRKESLATEGDGIVARKEKNQ